MPGTTKSTGQGEDELAYDGFWSKGIRSMRVIEEIGAEEYRVHTQIKSGILQIASSLKGGERRLRSQCPACGDFTYGFAFSM